MEDFQISEEPLVRPEPIIFCNQCSRPFNAKRETPREWMDSHRCRWCGERHEPTEIIGERTPLSTFLREEYVKGDDQNTELYVVKDQSDRVKVGISKHVSRRVATIQTDLPEPITLVNTYRPENPRQIEKEIHDMYESVNSHGEWLQLGDGGLELLEMRLAELVEP